MALKIKEKGGEFNILKALAILGLPFIHFSDEMVTSGLAVETMLDQGQILDVLVVFGPAVFMICMGFAMGGQHSYKRLIQTGIQFFLIQMILNICRFVIPKIPLLVTGEATWEEVIILCLESDIYMFVALFFIEYGLLKKAKLSLSTILIFTFVLFLLNSSVQDGTELPETFLTAIGGNFFTCNMYSYFPLMSWSIYPVLGIAICEATNKFDFKQHHKTIMHILICSALVFIASFWMIDYIYGEGSSARTYIYFGWYMVMNCETLLLVASISFISIGVTNLIYTYIKENFFERFIMKFSMLIMPFYLIHWVIVMITSTCFYMIFEEGVVTFGMAMGTAAVIMIVSLVLALKFGFSLMRFLLKITDYTVLLKKNKK